MALFARSHLHRQRHSAEPGVRLRLARVRLRRRDRRGDRRPDRHRAGAARVAREGHGAAARRRARIGGRRAPAPAQRDGRRPGRGIAGAADRRRACASAACSARRRSTSASTRADVLTVRLDPHQIGYDEPRSWAFYDELERRLARAARRRVGQHLVRRADGLFHRRRSRAREGAAVPRRRDRAPPVPATPSRRRIFATLRIPIVRGRGFTTQDTRRSHARRRRQRNAGPPDVAGRRSDREAR